jgi:hypothetical protein
MLRRADRRAEAVEVWAQWADRFAFDPEPRIEIAKHFEWHAKELEQAHAWTTAANDALDRQPPSPARASLRQEVSHRLARLERKLGKAQ